MKEEMPGLIGGVLCLDFVNTVDPRHASQRREYLGSYGELLAWARHARLLDPGEVERLTAEAAKRPREAARVARRAVRLREALYATFASARLGRPPPPAELDLVNDELALALAMARLASGRTGVEWRWAEDESRLDRVLWPIARSAADLLASARVALVRECAGEDGCGWLFLDTSKNKRRRWCDMRSCGNRAKARRYQRRKRASARRR